MSNSYIQGTVVCETCGIEMLASRATRFDGANEDYYLCDFCLYGKQVKDLEPQSIEEDMDDNSGDEP